MSVYAPECGTVHIQYLLFMNPDMCVTRFINQACLVAADVFYVTCMNSIMRNDTLGDHVTL